MKIVPNLILMLISTVEIWSQTNEMTKLPKRSEIARIEIVRGLIPWYKSDELLRIVSEFSPTKEKYQYGEFILKDGSEIEWRAANATSIAIQTGSGEQLYKLKEPEIKAQVQDIDVLYSIWDKTGKEGYINSDGQVIIKPRFDKVTDFSEGLAAVLIGDKWGYIDRKGEIVIKPRWKHNDRYIAPANPFKEGAAVVVEYANWAEDGDSYFCGYIDKTGEYIVKPQLRREYRGFSDGLAWVVTDKLDKDGVRIYPDDLNWGGFIDKKGNWVIKPELYRSDDFINGIARVRKYTYPEEKWYFIDKGGRTVPDKDAIEKQKAMQTDPPSKPALTLKMLKLLNISPRPNFRNIYGYENKEGKYVWLSPDAEKHLDKDWIKQNYVGDRIYE